MRRAKIVATLGPASDSLDMIEKLILSGMNVARINMSHGTHEGHAKVISNIREASKRTGHEIAVLLDLQGPKIRVDKLQKPLILKEGQEWVIGPTDLQDKYKEYKDNYIPTIYKDLVSDCHDGARILFDDGNLVAKAITKDRDVYKIKVEIGGELKSNKGINLPDCDVSAPSFTEKDREDLLFGLQHDVDYIALSFVRKAKDIKEVKYLLHKLKKNIPIVSKIEKPQAIDNIKEILEVTDVIMIARGDMGVELGNHLVPSVQKKLITLCNEKRIPVITATQMLESMTENAIPTRAEASDVANAIWDGTDAVMLSGETAAGKYPIVTVKTMGEIIKEAEKTPRERPFLRYMDLSNVNSSVMMAASMMAEKVFAKRILSLTESGDSCLKISMFRPRTSVLGVTNSIETARRLCLYWGVNPFHLTEYDLDNVNLQKDIVSKVRADKKLKNGDKIVITRGDGAFFARGSSNSVKVETIKDAPKVLGSDEGMIEAKDASKIIHLDLSICGSCHHCVKICPHDIWGIHKKSGQAHLNSEQVSFCAKDMECVEACPTGAIEIIPLDD